MIYFDHAASTPVDNEIINLMVHTMQFHFANPSSSHVLGKAASNFIEKSRANIAALFQYPTETIHFCHSATIAANILLQGYCGSLTRSNSPHNEIIISEIEHLAVAKTCEFLKTKGFKIHFAKVDSNGQVDLAHFKSLLNDHTAIVSIMAVNNEIGAIQDIASIGTIIKQFNPDIFFVCDFVQGIGKIPASELTSVDAWFIAGHKIGTPVGIACFYLNPQFRLTPILFGGGQESGLFPGTSDPVMPEILNLCIQKMMRASKDHMQHFQHLRQYFLEQLKNHQIEFILTIPEFFSVPNIISISFHGIKSNHLASQLEQENIFVSTRSACSSFCSDDSHVVKAIQLKRSLKLSPIRISFSHHNTVSEIDRMIQQLCKVLKHAEEVY